MNIAKRKRGSALIMVVSVLMAATILGITFATVAFYSLNSSVDRIENDQGNLAATSVIGSVTELVTEEDSVLIKKLFAANAGNNWEQELAGSFQGAGGIEGSVRLRFLSAAKTDIELQVSVGSVTRRSHFSFSETSRVVSEMEKIYDNTFFFEGSDYWSGGMSVTGNIYLNGNGDMSVNAANKTHNGDVICCGSLQINDGSIIKGNVVASGGVTLNDNVVVDGNIVSGGNVVIASGCVVRGNIVSKGNLTLYGRVEKNVTASGYVDIYTNSKILGSATCSAFMMWGGPAVYEGSDAAKAVLSSPPKIAKTEFTEKLPVKLESQEWKQPAGLEPPCIRLSNVISGNGTLKAGDVTPEKDLIFDTKGGDLHVKFIAENFNFNRDILVRGGGRVFLYLQGMFTLTGYTGKIEGFDSTENPDQCKLFMIGSGNDTLKIEKGGRLDGYVYLPAGEFYASGTGRSTGGKNYKIVGSITAKFTSINDDLGGEIVFAKPNLNDIIFNETQNTVTDIIYEWELTGFD